MRDAKLVRALVPLLVAASLSLLLAAAAGAETETKIRLALNPCVELADADAGGEFEYEQEDDKATLKVELWGANKLVGTAVHVFVDGKLVTSFVVKDEHERVSADFPVRVNPFDVRVILSLHEDGDSPVLSDRPC